MYEWYRNASECYVYLSDVHDSELSLDRDRRTNFPRSSWFRRGWTLQELLAPRMVVFCNSSWQVIGHLASRQTAQGTGAGLYKSGPYGQSILWEVNKITKIPRDYLDKTKSLNQASIAQRMSWASHRKTTRVEDEAYCLLGLFGINMPLLYGEGRKAFLRLQEEIMKRTIDQSILAWEGGHVGSTVEVLAESPQRFRRVDEEKEQCYLFRRPFAITNNGLEIRAKLLTSADPRDGIPRSILTLNYSRAHGKPATIMLAKVSEPNIYERASMSDDKIQNRQWRETEEQLIYSLTGLEIFEGPDWRESLFIDDSD